MISRTSPYIHQAVTADAADVTSSGLQHTPSAVRAAPRVGRSRLLCLSLIALLPLASGACSDDGDGSTVPDLSPEPQPTATTTPSSPSSGDDLFGAPSSGGGAGAGQPSTTAGQEPTSGHDDSACGGCQADALLRCDPATLRCVECLVAEDCAYGSKQQCTDGWCTNTDVGITLCPAQRVAHGEGCGLSGFTCTYGTEGRYSCRCGDGAAAGASTYEATVWTCVTE